MKKKILGILIISFMFLLFGCQEKTVVELNLIEDSVPSELSLYTALEEVKLIKFTVKAHGTEDVRNVEHNYLSEEDLAKLGTIGTHELTVNYRATSFKVTVKVADLYTVRVIDPTKTPIKKGISVQWCSGENCFLPQKINEAGVAKINLEDGEYYIHISGIPAGYTYNPNAYTTNASKKYVEIELSVLYPFESGDGSEVSPYVLSRGVYNVEFSEGSTTGMKYFAFTPGANGKYKISSMATDKLALNRIDPYIGFLGSAKDMSNIDVTGNKDSNIDINFSYEFEGEAGLTVYFVIMVSSADSYPANFDIVLE